MKIKPLYIVLLLAVCLALGFYWRGQALAVALLNARQNNAALVDSVRIVTTKNGALEAARLALVGERADLERLNKALADEVAKERGRVKTITRIETVTRRDTVRVPTTVTDQGAGWYRLGWSVADSTKGGSRSLAGQSTFRWMTGGLSDVQTEITKDELRLVLITGIRQRDGDGRYEIFVRTDYPGVRFAGIEGAVLDAKLFERPVRRWSVGPVVTVGLGPGGSAGVGLGVGVQYSLFRF